MRQGNIERKRKRERKRERERGREREGVKERGTDSTKKNKKKEKAVGLFFSTMIKWSPRWTEVAEAKARKDMDRPDEVQSVPWELKK